MIRVETYSVGEVVTSAQLNAIQDNALAINQLPGAMANVPYIYSDNGTSLAVGPIKSLMTTNTANVQLAQANEQNYAPTSPALVANQWYYLYAYNNAGSIAFEHSTGAPDAGLVFKQTDFTRRYLGCFRTDGSAAIHKFIKVGNIYQYKFQRQIITNAGVTAGATQSASAFVPPHCKLVELHAELKNAVAASSTGVTANFYFTGDTGTVARQLRSGANTNNLIVSNTIAFRMWLDSSNQFDYSVSTDGTLNVWVNGFHE